MPPLPLTTNATISFDPWSTHVTYSSKGTSTTFLADGSKTTFHYYNSVLIPYVINLNPVKTDYINVWNQQITGGQTAVLQTSSIVPTPTAITWTPTVGGNTTIIGGTTSVMPGLTYSSGNVTYSTTSWTGVWGKTTHVTGGTTQPPQTSTVTPYAYPTTSDKAPDPTLNTVKTTVKSASNSKSWGPKPTSSNEHTGSGCMFMTPTQISY
ncbi:hypothetical protein N7495_008297 [Penicillium taxi]|uniref:uncharacterized protein n=1 Tax=Penicillium taxi TaxID=168475 RepID=UPI002544EA44|nr:uncharacterized protein N7495_008297 [Penicillium taxi]KAJ5888256.1 hypothetical protein N7495_008297 [Penicillium taxi]